MDSAQLQKRLGRAAYLISYEYYSGKGGRSERFPVGVADVASKNTGCPVKF